MARPVRLSLPVGSRTPAHAPTPATWAGAVGVNAKELCPEGGTTKLLHFVRHAQGFHNVDPSVIRSAAGLDARLTPEGCEQCEALHRLTAELRPELVVSSPLTRTLQTAERCFGPQRALAAAPLLAVEDVRETVNFLCDARRSRTEIAADFPDADFSCCPHDVDPIWSHYEAIHGSQDDFPKLRESADLGHLAARARAALTWLAARPEKEIVIVSHQAFFWNTFNMVPGRANAHLPALYDFGGDQQLADWMCTGFANCECRSVLADFL
ncbi:hypothetical protein AB1Y20_003870 [Prymnesium parvum]|uniref:Uncharacterized protein n=1 Tax=Prymnesium parvum TaxID=97485 RepID=A0AB34J652_PRYPA